jgi:hypothetical protein
VWGGKISESSIFAARKGIGNKTAGNCGLAGGIVETGIK